MISIRRSRAMVEELPMNRKSLPHLIQGETRTKSLQPDPTFPAQVHAELGRTAKQEFYFVPEAIFSISSPMNFLNASSGSIIAAMSASRFDGLILHIQPSP